MKDCPVEPTIRSSLPEASRNAHGNLALQNRTFGAVRGVDTTKPASATPLLAMATQPAPAAVPAVATVSSTGLALMQKQGCAGCHAVGTKVMGPSFRQVADKYRADPDAAARLFDKLKKGSSGSWGAIPMPPQTQLSAADGQALVHWILAGAQ
jgi:cytochrome c